MLNAVYIVEHEFCNLLVKKKIYIYTVYPVVPITHLRVKGKFILGMRSPVFISQLKKEMNKTSKGVNTAE